MILKHVQKISFSFLFALLTSAFVLLFAVPAFALEDSSSNDSASNVVASKVVTKDNVAVVEKEDAAEIIKNSAQSSDKDISAKQEVSEKQDAAPVKDTEDIKSSTANSSNVTKTEVGAKTTKTVSRNTSSKETKTVDENLQATNATAKSIKFKVGVCKNGWVTEGSNTYYYVKNQAQTGWQVNNKMGNYGLQRFWLNSKGVLQKSKLLKANVTGWDTYATSKGYVARGKYKETNGKIYLANNDGRLENAGWLVTANYGNGLQRYYIDSSTRACKTSFFRVSKKLYLGDTNNGWEIRCKTRWGSGFLLIDNDGVIYEKEGWLTTSKYDGSSQKYRVDKSCAGYYGAHLGIFDVDGKRYYGRYDVGYVYRNDYDYIEGHWYVANNAGVLTNSDARFATIERYVSWMLSIAADNSHGYDQAYRWGERGDYDCSSLTITALNVAGIDTRWASYTGNMRSALTQSGFYCRGFDNLKRGDILLNDTYHVAVYIGNGMLVQASGNEWGEAMGGQPGDQTGYEIWSCSYYDYPWYTVLRYDC